MTTGGQFVVARVIVRWLSVAVMLLALGHLLVVGCLWSWLPATGGPGRVWFFGAAAGAGFLSLVGAALALAWSL